MKKSILIFVAIVMMAGFSNSVMAQVGATVTGTTAGAVIISPITLSEDAPLHFGVMAVSGALGTCVLTTGGTRSATGGVNLSAQAPLATNAAYTVGGQLSTTYAITLPASILVTHTNTVNTMTINTLKAKTLSAGVDGLTGTLSGTGADSFTVGGSLNVIATQLAGVYSGTFDVTVAYN
jgi:hypothetical protein